MNVRGGQHPEWDSEVRFSVMEGNGPGGKNRKLEVACYCQEPKTEDLLGRAIVDISDTLKTGEFDGVCCTLSDRVFAAHRFFIDWVSLDVDGVVRGDIYLEMTYYANTPAPAAPKNKLLAPAQGRAFGRRPSKLSPSDRLSRPIQQHLARPSISTTFYPTQLQDRINPTSSPLNNAVSPPRRNSSLLALLRDEHVHTSAALPNIRNRRSLSPQTQPVELPSILRPGLGGHPSSAPASDPRDFVRNRSSSDSSSSRPYNTDLSQLNPYIGANSAYTRAHTGLSNNVGTSSTSYTGGAYMAEQQHQQASGGRGYSPAPPGAFIPGNQSTPDGGAYIVEQQHQRASGGRAHSPASPGAFIPGNQPAPDGRLYSSASHVAPPNQNTGGSGGFMPADQQQQVSGGRRYSQAQSTMSVQVSVSSHPSVTPQNPYTGNGGLYLPERPNVPSYPLVPSPAQASMSSNYLAPTNPYTGANAALIPGSQQAPDGLAYSSAPPDNNAQTLGYANYSTPRQVSNGHSLPYNAGTEASGSVSSGSVSFPMPMIPIVVERHGYGYHEPSSYKSSYQPPLLSRTSPVDNNRRGEQDPYQLARYQTPLPLPPGSIKESPLPPLPPPSPTITSPSQVSSSTPEVVAPAPVPDTARVEVLRKVEEAAAWRKEQELKDLELAMQLDRELNLES